MDVFRIIGVLFDGCWDFFTELEFPGLGVTFAALSVGAFLAILGVRLLVYVFGFRDGGGGDTPRSSSTRRPKISKERRGDEF